MHTAPNCLLLVNFMFKTHISDMHKLDMSNYIAMHIELFKFELEFKVTVSHAFEYEWSVL